MEHFFDRIIAFLNKFYSKKAHQRLIVGLMAVVVFSTTYAMILPAITIERKTAEKEPGIEAMIDDQTESDAYTETETTAQTEEESELQSETIETQVQEETSAPVIAESDTAMPAHTFHARTAHVSVDVTADEGAFSEGTSMQVTPVYDQDVLDTIADAVGESAVNVQAVDITFYDINNNIINPQLPIRVVMTSDLLEESEDPQVVHVDHDGQAAVIAQVDDPQAAAADAVAFDAETFSIYAVVGTTIEKTVLASDGHNYNITVTCGSEAGIPEDADLLVEELSGEAYEKYLISAALNMDASGFDYARVFDITIVDQNGEALQPLVPVTVSIELTDSKAGQEDLSVVHFEGEEEKPMHITAATEGNVVSFKADGFSAYAIVYGPGAIPAGLTKLLTLSDLETYGSEGLYIGNINGYYLKNKEVKYSKGNEYGIEKTSQKAYPDETSGTALYYLEPIEGTPNTYYIYTIGEDSSRLYVNNGDDNSLHLSTDQKTAYEVSVSGGQFSFKDTERDLWWNMWGGVNGNIFAVYEKNDSGGKFYVWHGEQTDGDPYGLNGASYGLMNWNSGLSGRAMMAQEKGSNLEVLMLTVMSKTGNSSDKLFVPNDSDISFWTFEWIESDKYYLTAEVDGAKKYLCIKRNKLSLAETPQSGCEIQVIPGTGSHEGVICLKSGNVTLTYSGDIDTGFKTGGSAGTEWLKLVELSELTSDYFLTYTADKISVSDSSVTNGSHVIVYTRKWNDRTKKYELYAVDQDGSLVRCYESGNSIQWNGARLNSMLWDFIEHKNEDGTSSNYFDLYNEYSEKYLAPQLTDGQILADENIRMNLNGRMGGQYYTTLLAWDSANYNYAGLKADVDAGTVVPCAKEEADSFYFAIVQDIPADDRLHTVPTIDNTQHGITMKMVDYNGKIISVPGTSSKTTELQHEIIGTTTWSNATDGIATENLVSPMLEADGYPTSVNNEEHPSLGRLFANGEEKTVNHLFIESTYNSSGYFEYDSSQNYAYLGNNEDFTVYKELGTTDKSTGRNYTHGQFFPYDDLKAGVFAEKNKLNTTDFDGNSLPESDPRKNEQLYLVSNPDYYFGMELEAAFTQSPDGLDDWGHDIIFEFTGDDDMWLYIDGVRIIDLGGLHRPLTGTVNFRTGEVNNNGKQSTLKDIFEEVYTEQYGAETAQSMLAETFVPKTVDGKTCYVFKDYTTHTMKMFYMERGAGASNLHMRFNLASVKPGTVLLNKELSGVDSKESVYAEFPYQIWYRLPWEEGEEATEHLLTKEDTSGIRVCYENTNKPVEYKDSHTIDGVTYSNVFFLKPGETAEIDLPDNTVDYKIVECGVDPAVYDSVSVNGTEIDGTVATEGGGSERMDYGLDYASSDSRPRVNYVNHVNPEALSSLTIKKKLFREDGITPLSKEDDSTTFDLRLFMATESGEMKAANMQAYSVRDPEGNYCRWNGESQTFESTGEKDFSAFTTDAERNAVTFHTSINGSISKLPAFYAVEVRNVIAGTRFRVIERADEMPDGYALQKYVYYTNGEPVSDTEMKNADGEDTEVHDSTNEGTVAAGEDPQVDVCNLRGYGLRVNKVWSDAAFMQDRNPVYFAVFAKNNDNQLELVQNTVRQVPYGKDTAYWYFLQLPVSGITFDNYEIREVGLHGDCQVDENGVVTGFNKVDIIDEDGEVKLHGTLKDGHSQEYHYTVHYKKGAVEANTNVRTDTVTNRRPGVRIVKQDWAGHPLAGAVFTLSDKNGHLISTFKSDAEGFVTEAYLGNNVEYILTETKTPQGFVGLEGPMTINVNGNNQHMTVTGISDASCYSWDGDKNTLTIKNRPFTFRAIKVDADTAAPLQGVHFALHKQKTVGDVTSFDLVPMPGYEDLVSQADGEIPKLDNTLAPGTYELREKSPLAGYQQLPSHTYFTVSTSGEILLGNHPEDAQLEKNVGADGGYEYTLTIVNHLNTSLILNKQDDQGRNLAGARFKLYKYSTSWEVVTAYADIDLTKTAQIELTPLSSGRYRLEEAEAPDGYVIREKYTYFNVAANGEISLTDDTGNGTNANENAVLTVNDRNVLTVKNTPGAELPHTGGPGTSCLYLAGLLLLALAGAGFAWGRRKPWSD